MESHSHRNVHDENPYTKYGKSFARKRALRESIQKQMLVIRTEM